MKFLDDGLTYVDHSMQERTESLYKEVSCLKNSESVAFEDFDKIKNLINDKADVNSTFDQGKNLLQLVYDKMPLSKERAELFDFFIESKIDVNHRDSFGNTVLHYSVFKDRFDDVDYFLRNKADVNCEGYRGRNPLEFSYDNKNFNLFKFFIAKKADVNHQDFYGSTILHYAAANREIDYIECLVKNKDLKINVENNHGATALHAALSVGCLSEIIPMILFPLMFDVMYSKNKHMPMVKEAILKELNSLPIDIFLTQSFLKPILIEIQY